MGAPKLKISVINKRKPKQSKLTAISYLKPHISKSGSVRSVVKCLCVCGKEKNCVVSDLIRGNPLSCGCSSKRGRKSIYAIGNAVLYKIWHNMRERCYNPDSVNYKNYGKKGVIVCDEWKNSYESFAYWSLNNGYSPGLQLDKDIKGDGLLYSPNTCTWVMRLKNMSNKINSVKYDFKGEKLTIPEISRLTGVLQSNIKAAIRNGKTIEEAVYPKKKPPKFKRY